MTNYSAKPGGTSDFALRCFFLSHIFLPFLPDHQGSRPVLLPQSSTWIQECPHRSPQDFVHTCLRLFTVLPWPLSNHHVPSSMVSISPISGMTEPSWGPSSENIMCVCHDVFFIFLFRIFNMCGKLFPYKPSVGLVFSWVWLNMQMPIRKVTKT